MKKLTFLLTLLVPFVLLVSGFSAATDAAFSQGQKPQDVYTLSTEAKLGAVKFTHLDHSTKYQGADGKQIACVECHHTAQPASEVVKHPLHKTAWPTDRTTTLTAELLEKEPGTSVTLCRDCHARAETKPKLLPEIPQIKVEGSAEPVVLNNQQALHRNCAGCHDAIAKTKETTAPTSKKCVACHKKTAA